MYEALHDPTDLGRLRPFGLCFGRYNCGSAAAPPPRLDRTKLKVDRVAVLPGTGAAAAVHNVRVENDERPSVARDAIGPVATVEHLEHPVPWY